MRNVNQYGWVDEKETNLSFVGVIEKNLHHEYETFNMCRSTSIFVLLFIVQYTLYIYGIIH